jgi:hypothetical protein
MNGFQIGNKRLKVQHKRVHHRNAADSLPSFAPTPPQQRYAHPQVHMMVPPPQAQKDQQYIPTDINLSSTGFKQVSYVDSEDRQSYVMDSAARDFDSLNINDGN